MADVIALGFSPTTRDGERGLWEIALVRVGDGKVMQNHAFNLSPSRLLQADSNVLSSYGYFDRWSARIPMDDVRDDASRILRGAVVATTRPRAAKAALEVLFYGQSLPLRYIDPFSLARAATEMFDEPTVDVMRALDLDRPRMIALHEARWTATAYVKAMALNGPWSSAKVTT